MWQLLKAELEYHKRIFPGFLTLVVIIGLLEINSFAEDLSKNFLFFLTMFLLLQNWNALRNKENRDFQNVQLPLPIRRIALERIIMIFAAFVLLVGTHVLLQFLLARDVDYVRPLIAFALILTGFSIYYLMRDLMVPVLRRFGLTKTKIKWGLVISMVAFNILGIFFFLGFSPSEEPPALLRIFSQFIRFVQGANASDLGNFFVPALIFAALTIFSFGKRKSYFE